MSVSSVKTLFATVWQNFSADATNGLHLETVFNRTPRLIHPAHLPCVAIFEGPATYNYDQYGESIVSETRSYRCVVCVSLATLGNQETGEVGVEPFFGKVKAYFAARPGLEDDNASLPRTIVARARIAGDGGYVLFEYPSGSETLTDLYHAAEFNFDVLDLDPINYKD